MKVKSLSRAVASDSVQPHELQPSRLLSPWDFPGKNTEVVFHSLLQWMSNSVRPHRRQPTRFPCPWDSPGKNPGVGCHFLLQCKKVKSEGEVAQSCPTLSDPSLPGSSAHGIFQAGVLEWGAIAFSDQLSYQTQKEKGF